eukprot:6176444-Pleurochrysis_carterae.AAC.2
MKFVPRICSSTGNVFVRGPKSPGTMSAMSSRSACAHAGTHPCQSTLTHTPADSSHAQDCTHNRHTCIR